MVGYPTLGFAEPSSIDPEHTTSLLNSTGFPFRVTETPVFHNSGTSGSILEDGTSLAWTGQTSSSSAHVPAQAAGFWPPQHPLDSMDPSALTYPTGPSPCYQHDLGTYYTHQLGSYQHLPTYHSGENENTSSDSTAPSRRTWACSTVGEFYSFEYELE